MCGWLVQQARAGWNKNKWFSMRKICLYLIMMVLFVSTQIPITRSTFTTLLQVSWHSLLLSLQVLFPLFPIPLQVLQMFKNLPILLFYQTNLVHKMRENTMNFHLRQKMVNTYRCTTSLTPPGAWSAAAHSPAVARPHSSAWTCRSSSPSPLYPQYQSLCHTSRSRLATWRERNLKTCEA